MQISHQHKFIFFSFPKTGSESVRELLEPYSDIHGIPFWKRNEEQPFYSHISPQEVKTLFEKNGWDYDSYYKFTFVRNPWARLVSLYNMIYHTRPNHSFLGKIKNAFRRSSVPVFKEWLKTVKPDGEGAGGPENQRWQVYGAYSIASYILDKNGNKLVDEVIKLEEINKTLPVLLNRIGIPDADKLSIPFVNARRSKKYSAYFDTESIALIQDMYNYDIEHYDYSYDEVK